MTEDEFKELFWDTLEKFPPHILGDIEVYLTDNEMVIQIEVSDDWMDRAEFLRGQKYSAAITTFDYPQKYILALFRNRLLEAPVDICRAIIAHELFHIFVGPVLAPDLKSKPASKLHSKHVKNLCRDMERRPEFKRRKRQPKFDYEEALVNFATQSAGFLETAAIAWVNEYEKSHTGTEPNPDVTRA